MAGNLPVINIPDKIKQFLIKDLVSPEIVDGIGFKEFIGSILPAQNIPTVSEVSYN